MSSLTDLINTNRSGSSVESFCDSGFIGVVNGLVMGNGVKLTWARDKLGRCENISKAMMPCLVSSDGDKKDDSQW